jgi:hypothetical protein
MKQGTVGKYPASAGKYASCQSVNLPNKLSNSVLFTPATPVLEQDVSRSECNPKVDNSSSRLGSYVENYAL